MFAKFIGKPFQYEHYWNILKMEHKWIDNLTSNKRAKTHSNGSPTESTHVESCYSTPYLGDDTEPSSTPNLDRPLGRMTHPHPLLAAGVPATPQKSPAVTSND